MAGRIRREDIEALRTQVDIATIVSDHTSLKRAGTRLKGLCPFHSEKTPSFTVDPGRALYHCFGCGEGGDVIDFVMKIQGASFTEAVEQLARRTGITLTYEDLTPGQRRALGERSRLVELNTEALDLFRQWLFGDDGVPAREYLKSRGFGRADAERFRLGYALNSWDALSRELVRRGHDQRDLVKVGLAARNDRGGLRDRFRGRLIFPVFDATGDPIGFGGRILPGLDYGDFDPPKYYNSPETPLYRKTRVLYGLSQARTDMAATGEVLVCEGYTDVMALHQAGFGNAVATCGTAVGAEHFRVLSRYVNRVVLAFDSDAAGIRAAEKAWEQARQVDEEAGAGTRRARFELRVLVLPDGVDPADAVAGEGVERLRERVGSATPVVPFLLRSRLDRVDTTDEQARTEALREALRLLGHEPDLDLRRVYARTEIADVLGVSHEFVEATASRMDVELDRHAGADVGSLRHTQRGAVARVTIERAAHERAILRVALQEPEWLPDAWYELTVDDFRHPRARALVQVLAEAGGAGVDLDAVLAAAPDDDVRVLVRELALEEPAVPDTRSGTVQRVNELLAERLAGHVAALDDEIGRVNPGTDPDGFRELNRRRRELEQRRRSLAMTPDVD